MALLLEQIDRLEADRTSLERHRKKQELHFGSEILNLERKPSLFNNWPEQNRLRHEYLHRIEEARWRYERLSARIDQTLCEKQSRLLELLTMYDQLNDGNRANTT